MGFDHDARTGMFAPSVRIVLAAEWIGEQLFSEQSLLRLMERVHKQTGHTVLIGAQHGVQVRYLHVLQATSLTMWRPGRGRCVRCSAAARARCADAAA
jgi:DNA-binding IclR family transcriptional regulator